MLKLAEYRKLEPGETEEFIFVDHPSGYKRILAAMRWKAENVKLPPETPCAWSVPSQASEGTRLLGKACCQVG
jgi:STE24 endopeptidase